MTIIWHVDDLKILHVDAWEVTKIIKWLGTYGNIKVSRGKEHEYLGMHFDYRKEGEVRISMKQYVWDIIANFPEEIDNKIAATPAFVTRSKEEAKRLPEEQAVEYHHIVHNYFLYQIRQGETYKLLWHS